MVMFVLEGTGCDSFHDPLERIAMTIQRPNPNMRAARDLTTKIRNRETSFVIQIPLWRQEFDIRIDANSQFRIRFVRIPRIIRDLHNENPPRLTDLRRRNTCAVGSPFGLDQIINEPLHFGGGQLSRCYLPATRAQDWMADLSDFKHHRPSKTRSE